MNLCPQAIENYFRYRFDHISGAIPLNIPVVSPKFIRSAALITVSLLLIATFLTFRTDNFDDFAHYKHPSDSKTVTSAHDVISAVNVDWTRFAYVQYVTNTAYLCNSVMLFEILSRLQSKADRLLMYPSKFSVDSDSDSMESRLLRRARDEYNVKLMPIEVQARSGGDPTWSESYTKLLAFNQTQYDRVLSLDSDSTVLQTMDELFLSPPAPVAMPRAYWLNFNDRILSSQVVLVQPSEFEFNRISKSISEAGSSDYDMEIVNNLYRDSALIIPHRPYNLLTGEFRSTEHADYMGNSEEEWDPEKIFKEAKFLHFSDWPVPKPWITASASMIKEKQPKCGFNNATGQNDDCRARDIWLGAYEDFAKRRKVVCDLSVSGKRKRSDSTDDLPEPPSQYDYIV